MVVVSVMVYWWRWLVWLYVGGSNGCGRCAGMLMVVMVMIGGGS